MASTSSSNLASLSESKVVNSFWSKDRLDFLVFGSVTGLVPEHEQSNNKWSKKVSCLMSISFDCWRISDDLYVSQPPFYAKEKMNETENTFQTMAAISSFETWNTSLTWYFSETHSRLQTRLFRDWSLFRDSRLKTPSRLFRDFETDRTAISKAIAVKNDDSMSDLEIVWVDQ